MNKLLLVTLMAIGMAVQAHAGDLTDGSADVRNLHQKNFTGQRAYSKTPDIKQQNPEEKWEGAGIITDKPEKGFDKHQQMQLNFIGRRPYIGKTSAD